MRTSLDHWLPLWQRLEATGDAAEWHARLMAAYAEPQRAYHSLQHLDECLRAFDEAKPSGLIQRPNLIEMALWFHDAVYDPKSGENEVLSAQMAVEALGDTSDVQEVARLILLTKSHQRGNGADDAWVIDIDLAIFGQSVDRVAEYERQIRQEYAWVPEVLYREKRSEILTRFLTLERIYQTEFFRRRYEESARKNLAALITQLR